MRYCFYSTIMLYFKMLKNCYYFNLTVINCIHVYIYFILSKTMYLFKILSNKCILIFVQISIEKKSELLNIYLKYTAIIVNVCNFLQYYT